MTLQFNDQMISSFIIITLLCILCIVIGKKVDKVDPLGKTPLWLVPIIAVVEIVNNFCKENIGTKYKNYAPFILTIAVFLFFSNISAIFLLTSPTSYIMINFALSITVFFIIQITGIVSLGVKKYFGSYVGEVKLFAPLMIPINIIGELALPISLALRLLGNIMSGAVLSKILFGTFSWWIVLPAAPFMNIIFDLLFGTIQVIVFVLLSVIFISLKVNDEEKIEN